MEHASRISLRLEEYLSKLNRVGAQWTDWIMRVENSVVVSDANALTQSTDEAAELMSELKSMLMERQQLLDDASACGLTAMDLTTLARRLPLWKDPVKRQAVAAARTQLNHLQRLHYATWVFIHQSLQHCSDIMRYMASGRSKQDVYTSNSKQHPPGGRLLDRSA